MAHEIMQIDDVLVSLRIRGVMRLADMVAIQALAHELIERGKKPRCLIVAEDFQGWDKQDDWNDINFFMEHGDDIEKMAIVGDERWKDDIFLFTGKGLRKTQIEFFPASALNEAEAWLRA
jgi:hypothetical protein